MEDKKAQEPETIVVNINEKYGEACLQDGVRNHGAKSRKPEGFVEIYSVDKDGVKQKVGKSNLVLLCGREWIAQRICNAENIEVAPSQSDFISWFGLGYSGTPPGDAINPMVPTNDMVSLSNEVPLSGTDTLCTDFRTPESMYYKHPLDSIVFQQDTAYNDTWIILKITITISMDHANGYNLSEAGLYLSDSNDSAVASNFNIFSLVTFPSIAKDNTRQLVFYWYLYC